MHSIGLAHALAATWFALPIGDEPPAKEWSQPHGNAASTAFVDVVPLKAPPTERWQIKSEQPVVGPVVWQAKLFAVVREGGKRQIVVVDPASGASIAKHELEGSDDAIALTVADGMAAVFTASSVQGWRLQGGELRLEKTVSGSFGAAPTQFGRSPVAARGGAAGLLTIDWAKDKPALLVPKGFGRATGLEAESVDPAGGDKVGRYLIAASCDDAREKMTLSRFAVTSTSGPLKLGPAEVLYTGPMVATPDDAPNTVLIPVKGKSGREWFGWFGNVRGSGLLHKEGVISIEFRQPPAATGSRLYGFDTEDRLIEFDVPANATHPLIEKENLRTGAKLGAPSIARDTLYLGNWAVELGSKRVLWCLESLEADGPAIPAGDELIAIKTKDGRLLGFGNGPGSAKVGAAAAGAKAPSSAHAVAVPVATILPGTKPGIVRSDGVFVAGKASALDGGRWRIEPESGPESGRVQELDADAVALVDSGKEVRRLGDERAVYLACWAVLAHRHAEALVTAFDQWKELKLFEECQRVLEDAKRAGLDPARVDELVNSIAGKASAKLGAASPQRKRAVDFEGSVREKGIAELVDAAKWCAAHDSKMAATVLVARAAELSPQKAPDPSLVEPWIPENFPASIAGDAPERAWLTWADALLPSGAAFAVLDESTKRRMSTSKFGQEALALRTKNILMFSRETNPGIIGPLLARGEATVRALQKILGPSPTGLKGDAPLEVRLHRTREEYLADRIGGGSGPVAWSAGVFSPAEGISRFYSQQAGDESDPLSHTLHEVFAHELSHHYVDRRWVRSGPRAAIAGYWLVEGFAEFVAGQALEIGRLGETFDDPTVLSIDQAAAAFREDQLLPLEYLISLDAARFNKELEGGRFGPVQLKHNLKQVVLDKRGVFYAEATALTFFVMNRCGEKGRPAYKRWLAKFYAGEPLESPWKELDFADLAAFRKAFNAFLAGI